MKYFDGQFYLEVKDHRYKIHPTDNNILLKGLPPKSLRTQYQVQNETQIKKNQKIIRNNNNESDVKNYPKIKQPVIQQQPKFKPPDCLSCKRNIWLEIDGDYYCQNCEYIFNEQKHQIDKKVLRQDIIFQLGCSMLIKRLKRYIILWLILLIIQHKI